MAKIDAHKCDSCGRTETDNQLVSWFALRKYLNGPMIVGKLADIESLYFSNYDCDVTTFCVAYGESPFIEDTEFKSDRLLVNTGKVSELCTFDCLIKEMRTNHYSRQ